jgi:cyclic pyranopterin phosphate synthase
MPELAGRPEWAVDIDRVHGWLEEQATRIENREMHDRRRYWVPSEDGTGEGMVEIVDPVENESFCANCHRVRVTHQGFLKGCLNRNDDLKPMGEMARPAIRDTCREPVRDRVPYYGEYMIRDGDGDWVVNEEHIGV